MAALSAVFVVLFGSLAVVGTAAAPAVLAYQGCNTSASGSASPSSADAGVGIDFTVTFRDCNGQAVATAVAFSQQAGPAGCTATFNPPSARTDANGTAHTTVTLPAGCPCQYTLAATGGGVTVTSTVRENGCLPFTAAVVSAAGSRSASPLEIVGVALVALGAALLLLVAGSRVVRRRA